MSHDPDDRKQGRQGDYRIYRSGGDGSGGSRGRASTHAARGGARLAGDGDGAPGDAGGGRFGPPDGPPDGGFGPPEYNVYRSQPRGLIARLRGESDADIGQRVSDLERRRQPRPLADPRPWWRRRWTWKRGLAAILAAIVGWVLLSFVLFMISAQNRAGDLPAGAESQLTSGGPMLTSANTVLILGLDNRPTTGPGSKEPGSNYNERLAATDTIMLWRIGGGVSRRLSIPRDTLVNIPGVGDAKINAAWASGGPALALRVIKQFTGLQINHLIVVDLGNFPKFIDTIGGVTVTTGRICSNISGGVKNGGFTLDLQPGSHHLNGIQALTYARTRENSCDPAYNDLNREAAQQEVLNGIKSQLLTFHAFIHLPWAAWDAPGVIQTDMGGLSLMQLFIASEIGGSAPPSLLTESSSVYNGQDVLIPNQANVQAQVHKLLDG